MIGSLCFCHSCFYVLHYSLWHPFSTLMERSRQLMEEPEFTSSLTLLYKTDRNRDRDREADRTDRHTDTDTSTTLPMHLHLLCVWDIHRENFLSLPPQAPSVGLLLFSFSPQFPSIFLQTFLLHPFHLYFHSLCDPICVILLLFSYSPSLLSLYIYLNSQPSTFVLVSSVSLPPTHTRLYETKIISFAFPLLLLLFSLISTSIMYFLNLSFLSYT